MIKDNPVNPFGSFYFAFQPHPTNYEVQVQIVTLQTLLWKFELYEKSFKI